MRRLIILSTLVLAAAPAAACPPHLDRDPDFVIEPSSDGSTLKLTIRNVRPYAVATQSCPSFLDVRIDGEWRFGSGDGECTDLVVQPNEAFVVTRELQLSPGSHDVYVHWMTGHNSKWPADVARIRSPPFIEASRTMHGGSTPHNWLFALAVLGLAGAFVVGRRATFV